MVKSGHEPMMKKAWNASVAFNKKMTRLLAANGVVLVHPAPDYMAPHTDWVTAEGPYMCNSNRWQKETMALLRHEPKSMKGFSFMPKGEVT